MDFRLLNRLLENRYGRWRERYPDSFPAHGAEDPLDTLVLTILSQATNDNNSLRAYEQLRQTFPSWHQVAVAETEAVARALRPGGLARQKAKRIQDILRVIEQQRGSLDGRFLDGMSEREAFDYLVSFPGVGPKTAACVLLFALGYPRFPVDTHVARVARRLGLVPSELDAVRIQERLEALVPDALKLDLHVNLIEHGRSTCRARAPLCESCVVRLHCAHAAGEQSDPGRPGSG